jgi:hypothetical protein
VYLAADNYNLSAGNPTLFNSVSDFVTKGIPLTGIAIVRSFANTGRELGAWVSGNDYKESKAEDWIKEIDSGGNMLKYYKEHEMGIESAAVILGSFAPGLLAAKAVKLATSAKSLGAFGDFLSNTAFIQRSEAALVNEGTVARAMIESQKVKGIFAGFADQTLQAAAWEVATIATMHANPTLNESSVGELTSNVLHGALFGGAIGGAIEGFVLKGVIGSALVKAEHREGAFKIIKDMGAGDYLKSDVAVAMLSHMDDMLAAANKLEGPGPSFGAIASKTADRAQQAASATLAKITPTFDLGVQDELLKTLLKWRSDGSLTNEGMYEKLAGLAMIRRVGLEDSVNEATMALNANLKAGASELGSVLNKKLARAEEQLRVATTPEAKKAAEEAVTAAKNVLESATPIEADALHVGASGFTAPRYLNLKTGKESDTVFAHLGDLAKAEDIKLSLDGRAIVVGKGAKQHVFEQAPLWEGIGRAAKEVNPQHVQARYLWADMRRDGKLFDFAADFSGNKGISVQDIPVMEALYKKFSQFNQDELSKIRIKDETGKLLGANEWEGLGAYTKLDVAEALLAAKQRSFSEMIKEGKSAEEIAIRLNVPAEKLPELLDAGRGKIDDFIRPIEDITSTNHVAIQYDGIRMASTDGNLVMGMMGAQQRIMMDMERARDYALKFFAETGEDAISAQQFMAPLTAQQADIIGAAPTFFGSRDPNVGTLASWAQNVGAAKDQLQKKLTTTAYEVLAPKITALMKNQEAGTETMLMDNILRRTGEKYEMYHPNQRVELAPDVERKGAKPMTYDQAKAAMIRAGVDLTGAEGFFALRNNFKFNQKSGQWIYAGTVPEEAGFVSIGNMNSNANLKGKYLAYPLKHKETVDFYAAHETINDARRVHMRDWNNAVGNHNQADEITKALGVSYAPAIDTTKHKYVVFVKENIVTPGTSAETHAITAHSQEAMQAKIKDIQTAFPEYKAYTKDELKAEFKIRGEYDIQQEMSSNRINDALVRKGILSDLQPDLNINNFADNYLRWHGSQIDRMVSNHVELANGQLFAELRHLGNEYTNIATSKVQSTIERFVGKNEKNPFSSYIDVMLNKNPREHFPLWSDINTKSEAFFNAAFAAAPKLFSDAQKGLISYEKASLETERLGLGNPYKGSATAQQGQEAFLRASTRLAPSQFAELVRTGNSIVAATQIRLDVFQNLINIASTPILLLAQASNVKYQALKELTTVGVPGSNQAVPSGVKVLAQATRDFFSAEKNTLFEEYSKRKFILNQDDLKNFHAVQENLARAGEDGKGFAGHISGAVDKTAALLGGNLAENFTRFVTARAGHLLYEAQGLQGEELWQAVRIFTNRTQGNYIASQRPAVFQGVLGQAVGLFQTYQFNLMQQLFRFVEEGDKRSLAVLGGMQASLFGMQGLPGFNILNTHIVGSAAGNEKHTDLFNMTTNYAGKPIADWLLYGSMSNILNTGLYSRGDINPRQVSILPINPVDWPAITAARKTFENVANVAGQIANGGSVAQSLLFGMEHNGLSRPLSGVAQVIQGYSTTSKNTLVSSNDFMSWASLSRIAGSRPLDEAIAMDGMYRKTMYDAVDTDRLKSLGAAVRTTMVGNREPTEEQTTRFQAAYAAAGGSPQRFGAFMVDAMSKANSATANLAVQKLNSPKAQNLFEIMGNKPMQDFNLAPRSAPPTTQTGSVPTSSFSTAPAATSNAPSADLYSTEGNINVAGGGSTTSSGSTRTGTNTSGPRA